jgi:hypothetical protein
VFHALIKTAFVNTSSRMIMPLMDDCCGRGICKAI